MKWKKIVHKFIVIIRLSFILVKYKFSQFERKITSCSNCWKSLWKTYMKKKYIHRYKERKQRYDRRDRQVMEMINTDKIIPRYIVMEKPNQIVSLHSDHSSMR